VIKAVSELVHPARFVYLYQAVSRPILARPGQNKLSDTPGLPPNEYVPGEDGVPLITAQLSEVQYLGSSPWIVTTGMFFHCYICCIAGGTIPLIGYQDPVFCGNNRVDGYRGNRISGTPMEGIPSMGSKNDLTPPANSGIFEKARHRYWIPFDRNAVPEYIPSRL